MGHRKSLVIFVAVLFAIGVVPYLTQDVFAHQTSLSSWVANDPDDGDSVFSAGDTLTLTFALATNQTLGLISQSAIDGNFTFNGGTVSDGTYTGNWIDTSNLVITILTAGTTPIIDTTTAIPKAGNTIGVSGEGAGADSTHTEPQAAQRTRPASRAEDRDRRGCVPCPCSRSWRCTASHVFSSMMASCTPSWSSSPQRTLPMYNAFRSMW